MTKRQGIGEVMPKVRKPKNGWPRLPIPRRFRRVKKTNTGLPPCPECKKYSIKRDERRGEKYCSECGLTL
ncbi:MAG TPA: TFIIB-type zinc ribbon-containing protein [Candidatus Poseidoniales archaeon]|nr:MAG TPA: TFIIB-type zinc ribbon-containing protein [Candidatus Poseidoniales archaeon]